METWRAYNNKYEVSDHGNVRHRKHRRNLKYSYPKNGTPQVNLDRSLCVSRLVATMFLGERPDGFDVHHKDHNPSNNRADNLEYVPKKIHRRVYHRKNPVHYCPICKEILNNNRRKTCSRFCQKKLINAERICKTCGKTFTISHKVIEKSATDSRYTNGAGQYCSQDCHHKYRKGQPNYKNTKEYRLNLRSLTAPAVDDSSKPQVLGHSGLSVHADMTGKASYSLSPRPQEALRHDSGSGDKY